MSARWGWALVGGVVAGALAVGIVAAVDDGPGPATAQETTAQETTTTLAPASSGAEPSSGGATPLRTVTVTADGTASGTPDTALVQLGVQTQATKANDALDQANQKAAQLLDALSFGGVAKEDITTSNVFVYPQTGNDGRTITGYQAGNTVSVKIRDITQAGAIIDAAAEVVGDEILLQGVSFTIDDTGSLREAARADAVDNAKAQADQLAAAAGLQVGRIVSMSEGTNPNLPPPIAYGAGDLAAREVASAVPLEPGQQELSLSVTVVYELNG